MERSEALTIIEPGAIERPLPKVSPSTVRYLQDARSRNTRAGYARDFRRFERWCEERGLSALPATPETVANFASHRADEGKKISTIRREVAAIARTHRLAGIDPLPTASPGVRETLSGVARAIGSAVDRVPPILRDDLRVMAATFDGDLLRDIRDRAVLLSGWITACRRSELVALDVPDFTLKPDGAEFLIRRSKNDQLGEGLVKVVHHAKREPELCAVLAVQRWLRVSGIQDGPLFRTIRNSGKLGRGRIDGETIARIVQRAANRAGIEDRAFSAHSLRAGCISQMALDNVPDDVGMKHTGHRSIAVYCGYKRRALRWDGTGATAELL